MNKPANLRDLGGIPVRGGKTVKMRKLLRSGELCGMTEEEKSILQNDYCLAEVLDFRSAKEFVERPDASFPGVPNTNIDLMANAEELVVSFDNFEAHAGKTAARGFMLEAYDLVTGDDLATQGIRQFFAKTLEDRDGALLFHCFAGKDRTGMTAAFLLRILGADMEDIFDDYLKTNEQRKAENAAMIELERAQGKSEGELAVLGEFLVVRREYLQYAFDNIDKLYGGFDRYIGNAIGLTDADIGRLRELYLA